MGPAIHCSDRDSVEGAGIAIPRNAVARADSNYDGKLNGDELALFVNAMSRPEMDQR